MPAHGFLLDNRLPRLEPAFSTILKVKLSIGLNFAMVFLILAAKAPPFVCSINSTDVMLTLLDLATLVELELFTSPEMFGGRDEEAQDEFCCCPWFWFASPATPCDFDRGGWGRGDASLLLSLMGWDSGGHMRDTGDMGDSSSFS